MSPTYTVPLFERLQELIDEYKMLRREADVDTLVEAIERIRDLEEELEFTHALKDWDDDEYPLD
jgi:cobalamin biosynthesis Mg chelatase CobN